jgi:kinesin family protein C1
VAVQGPTGGRRREVARHSFEFDQVFSFDATQRRIFAEIEPLLQSVMDGYRVCIFAYGQTGSGKTFTMEGKMDGGPRNVDDDRGVIPRCMQSLLAIRDDMRKGDWDIDLKVLMCLLCSV